MTDSILLQPHLDRAIDHVWALVTAIGRATADAPGITRTAWGPGEQLAAEHVMGFAQKHGLIAVYDGFGNIHITLPGQDPAGRAVTTGSHLDSVPHGGNYDGLAGVAAGIAIAIAAREAGVALPGGLRVVAMRCEESPWYGAAYLGSKLMLGLSTLEQCGGLVRVDSGRTLQSHMQELGFGASAALLGPHNVAAFFELHIEQGPLLEDQGVPVGIATACRGNVRFPQARCFGEYGHSAALPRQFRRDAVLAVAQLALGMDAYWAERIAQGDADFVNTVGIVATDPEQHAMTKVAGEVRFSLNLGATSAATLDEAHGVLRQLLARIEAERGVRFDLGRQTGSLPMPMDPALMQSLERSAAGLGLVTRRIPTVGHDCAMFLSLGIPAAMVMTRNAGGSHNPAEHLAREDFAAGVSVLAGAVLELAAIPA